MVVVAVAMPGSLLSWQVNYKDFIEDSVVEETADEAKGGAARETTGGAAMDVSFFQTRFDEAADD